MKTKIITLILLATMSAQAQFKTATNGISFSVATSVPTNAFFILNKNGTNQNISATNVLPFLNAVTPIPYATVKTQRGSTNVTALTSFKATFATAFADTNYTATAIGNGFALTSCYVSSKTTTNCVFNMTSATGTIDWLAVRP